jgi:hypothetical protein
MSPMINAKIVALMNILRCLADISYLLGKESTETGRTSTTIIHQLCIETEIVTLSFFSPSHYFEIVCRSIRLRQVLS